MRPRGSVPGDFDLDGIPEPLDVDDDGDLILDNIDRSNAALASQLAPEFSVGSGLGLGLSETDTEHASRGFLLIHFVPGDSAELDCGHPNTGLVYCRRNGSTGTVFQPGVAPSAFPSFPSCCDEDHDGFGTFQVAGPNLMQLVHGATTDQIRTGQVVIERLTSGGNNSQLTALIQYIFASVPALVAYDDGQGNSSTISYPVVPTPALAEGLPVTAGPSGDVVVRLTFRRPQRRAIPGETGDWIDIGQLVYSAQVGAGQGCPANTFSSDDPNLLPSPPPQPGAGGFSDQALDRPADPANTFSFTLNMTQCLQSAGLSFQQDDARDFTFPGITTSAVASQAILFKRK
jgi:hypothetical protein